MVTPTTDKQTPAFEDVEMEPPEGGGNFETIPAGMYPARLIGFTTCDKPDWKLTGEEGEDRQQWKWTFQIEGGDYDGWKLDEYTNRTWHERAKAHKHAAALLGVPELPVGQGLSTKVLAGKTCQLWVIEKGTKKDPNDLRNYIDKVVPTPTARMRPQTRPQAPQGTVKPLRVQVEGLPVDDPDDGEWEVTPA